MIIKAQRFRTQEQNREDALERLRLLVRSVAVLPKRRIPTRPGKAVKQRRLDDKGRRGERKRLRKRVEY